MKIVFTGGGTGGHLFPLIAVVEELRRRRIHSLSCIYIGPDTLAPETIQSLGISVKKIVTGKIRRYWTPKNVLDIGKIFFSLLQCYWALFWTMPDLILGKGGYASFPALLVGVFFRIPIIIHESDSIPGLVNKIFGRFARAIAYSFEFGENYFPHHKLVFTGHPIRKSLLEGKRENAQTLFNLSGEKKTLLIIGGSQGSRIINDAVLAILPQLLRTYEIIHQCGLENIENVKKESAVVITKESIRYYHPLAFFNEGEMAAAYASADFIVSRAGAGSIFEIAAIGKPSILIPLASSASNHQKQNAYLYHRTGACTVVEEMNLQPHIFLETIERLAGDETIHKEMSEAAKRFAKPEAAALIADEILKIVGTKILKSTRVKIENF